MTYFGPSGYEPADDDCVDEQGNEYPEHDYDETECCRCGAEPRD